jgi:hypothetical protein
MRLPRTIFTLAIFTLASALAQAQTAFRDREIAARFAPVFYQAIGDNARSDYLTNFDFDGDWRGDNNWDHVSNKRFPLKAYIYFSVSETPTHWFIHYAVFHARDYKGGTTKGRILSEVLREGANVAGEYDPSGMAAAATVAHENDMEGCLVVVEKSGSDPSRARVVFVETLAHNRFLKYGSAESGGPATSSSTVAIEGQRPLLYIEPKGHGIQSYLANREQESEKKESKKKQSSGKESKNKKSEQGMVVYKFAGRAEQPDKVRAEVCGYDLIPIQTTLWTRARGEANETYGVSHDYAQITIRVVSKGGSTADHTARVGAHGVAFLGKKGGQNIARPPWGWFDAGERDQPLGGWFFDPAKTIKRHFKLDESFPTAYIRHPILGIGG